MKFRLGGIGKAFFVFTALTVLCPANAQANSAIPGPLIIVGMSLYGRDPLAVLQWVAATMFMCIGIEGAIYYYLGLFVRPYVASALANIISLVLGIPLVLIGIVDPTLVVIPTILSIAIELLVLGRFRLQPAPQEGNVAGMRRIAWPAIGANILTNALLVVYMFIASIKLA